MFFKGSRYVREGEERNMVKSTVGMLLLTSLALLWVPAARADRDVAKVGQDIVIPEGETAGDIACVFCDVRVKGDVKGDVAVAFGDLEVDPGRQISGDVALLGGHVRLGDSSRIGGDLAVVGLLREGEDVNVRGSRAVLPGALLLAPLLLLAGIVWLIVHLVRRSRYRPTYPPGYPGRRM
jgi:predicted acyltransferase (DUF342 family)